MYTNIRILVRDRTTCDDGVPEKVFEGVSEFDIALPIPETDFIDSVEELVTNQLRTSLVSVTADIQKRKAAYIERELASGMTQLTLELGDGEAECEAG